MKTDWKPGDRGYMAVYGWGVPVGWRPMKVKEVMDLNFNVLLRVATTDEGAEGIEVERTISYVNCRGLSALEELADV